MTATRPSGAALRGHARLRRAGWWAFFLTVALYSAYAAYLGGVEILAMARPVDGAKARALPVAFVVHALTGAVALAAGALQFNRRLRRCCRGLHRVTGRVYVAAVWAAGIAGLASALLFDVVIAARIAFVVLGVLWLTATTVAFDRIRRQRVTQHREWMIRSYALALFIVTFEFWTGGLEATPLPGDVAYPLGVLMAWLVNLAVAEGWIRRTRCKSTARTRSDDRIGPRARIAV